MGLEVGMKVGLDVARKWVAEFLLDGSRNSYSMGRGILNARRVGIPEKRKVAGEWSALQREREMFELGRSGEEVLRYR